jgi:hypothetical protein
VKEEEEERKRADWLLTGPSRRIDHVRQAGV